MEFWIRNLPRYLKQAFSLISSSDSPSDFIQNSIRVSREFRNIRNIRRLLRRKKKGLSPVYANGYKHQDTQYPLVSIIVPSYNHEKFLEARLLSIYGQTYPNIEVILLDDNSTDNSQAILSRFQKYFPEKTELIFNEINSGSGYLQWSKGIEKARGELVWIAESDDLADERFLEIMVRHFEVKGVALAFSNTSFFRYSKNNQIWTVKEYWSSRTDLSADVNWQIMDYEFLRRGMAQSNLIPNISGVVFKRNAVSRPMEDWSRFKYAADWYFYALISQGSLISFERTTLNFYRIHEKSTIAMNRTKESFTLELNEIKELIRELSIKPRILLCIPGLVAGGGELFPFRLAFTLTKYGYITTMLNLSILNDSSPGIFNASSFVAIIEPNDLASWLVSELQNFQVVHTHHASVDKTISTFNSTGVPHLVSLHGMYEEINKKDVESCEFVFSEKEQLFTFTIDKNLSAFSEDFLRKRKFIQVRNFIPDAIIPKTREKSELNCINVSIIARAIEGKGWHEGIEAVRLANSKLPGKFSLSLYGSGPVNKLCRRMYQHEWLNIYDGTDNSLLELSRTDVYLFLSTYLGESMPLILLECLATGTPVVATDRGKAREMLTDDFGFIGFPISNFDGTIDTLAVADALIEFSEMSEDDKRKIEERMKLHFFKYSEREVISDYLSIYSDLVQNRVTR